MKHIPRGCLTGEPLNVVGTDSDRRVKQHRRPEDLTACMRHKNIAGRMWTFWPSNFRALGQARGSIKINYSANEAVRKAVREIGNVVDMKIRRPS